MAPKITIDPEFRALIPPLRDGELATLEASLIHEGCRDSLVTWNGVLVDGHNRHTICQREGLVFKTKEIELPDRNAAKLWIIDNQMGRRNISDLDRIGLQSAREEVLREIGKANQVRKPKSVSAKLPKQKVNTRKTLAKAADVGERTYDAGKLVLEAEKTGEIPKAVVDEVRNGKRAIHAVAKDIKEQRQKSAREFKRKEAAEAAPSIDSRIIVGDFRKHADKVADGSVSLIFTDPPYDQKAIELFSGLAEFAAKKLADGGSLVMYVGHLQLPAVFKAFEGRLRYWWTCACVHAGSLPLMKEYGIRAGWKPMVWFVKGTRDDKSNIIHDTVSGGQEKATHEWQQAESEAEHYIQNLCPKDGVVCDPFLGGGTTAVVAKRLKREWVGFEIDEATAASAAERIAQ